MFEIKSILCLPVLSFLCSEIRSCEHAGVAQSTYIRDILLIYKQRFETVLFMASIMLKLPVHFYFTTSL